ncbi:hypothetical protein C8R45DRAFT_1004201, partial [Mycena sanguinolenta]
SCNLFVLLGLTHALSAPSPYSAQIPFKTHPSMPADLPQRNPTRSFWIHSPGANPLAAEGSTGALTDTADVCIIGSGITGVSAVYHLANAVKAGRFPVPHEEAKVRAVILDLILEAREFCSGATGGNGGNLTPYEFFSFRKIESLFGHETALQFYAVEDYSVAERGRPGGHINAMLTELSQLQADFAGAIAEGRDVDASWLDREEMNARGTSYKPVGPTTHRGAVRCSSVLHATNGYASHLFPHMAGPSGIVPVREQVVAIRAGASLEVLGTTSWLGNEGYWFPAPLSRGNWHRSSFLAVRAVPPFEVDTTDDSVINANVGIVLRNFLPEMFPGLYRPGSEPDAEWVSYKLH